MANPAQGRRPDSRLSTHPGWFHRCRQTGELQWVPASAVPDSEQESQQPTVRPT